VTVAGISYMFISIFITIAIAISKFKICLEKNYSRLFNIFLTYCITVHIATP